MSDERQGHSEEYFGPYRDFWWNRDFLDLMAKRWGLGEHSTLLDVGAGLCHWSKLLAPYLRAPAAVAALDRDPKWAAGDPATTRFFEGFGATLTFQSGDAHHLPFPDATFDVVTCQTVLIHCANPFAVVCEMKRVAKPGGLVICVEPNNLANGTAISSLDLDTDIDTVVARYKEDLLVQRGKAAAGEGFNSIGDQVPAFFQRAGFTEIRSYLSDRVYPWLPPYDDPAQRANVEQARQQMQPLAVEQNYEKAKRYVAALGIPAHLDFLEQQHAKWAEEIQDFLTALDRKEYTSPGLAVVYLISGRA